MSKSRLIIIGGGAAGVFAAALCAEKIPDLEVILLEKTRQFLSKVKISGGGRCNVTHAQFDSKQLIQHYPRGNPELLGAFYRFQPKDTIEWFEQHGVSLKTEEDGRIFPTTDCSATIIHCLLDAAKEGGAQLYYERSVQNVEYLSAEKQYRVEIANQPPLLCDYLLLATGGSSQGHQLASSLGHEIIPPVPSLFTFNVPTSPLSELSGITVDDVSIQLPLGTKPQRGPLLITHFGFSGPAVLKLSAFAARQLHACAYHTNLVIDWVPRYTQAELLKSVRALKQQHPHTFLKHKNPFQLPSNLWKALLTLSGMSVDTPVGHLSDKQLESLCTLLHRSEYAIAGKTTHKAEFVTCGGVHLKEVDCKTMQSLLSPHLFFAGEILNIDGVTGGFNFQNAWTSAYLVATYLEGVNKKI